MGLEPTTPCLQSRCATNCATPPGAAAAISWPAGVGPQTLSVASAQRSCSALSASSLRQTTKAPTPARVTARSFFTADPPRRCLGERPDVQGLRVLRRGPNWTRTSDLFLIREAL